MVSLFSDQDLKACPLQCKHGVLSTGPPGKSQEKNNFKRNTKMGSVWMFIEFHERYILPTLFILTELEKQLFQLKL